MSTLRGVILTTLPMLLASSAWAKDYVVSPRGSDRGDGSQRAPWKTIQKAADSVKDGDRVIVEDGEYRGFTVDDRQFGPKGVVFVARNRWKARVTSPSLMYGKDDGIAIVASSYVTIDGFEVTGAKRAGIVVRSWDPDPTGRDTRNNVIRNCWSHDNGKWGSGSGAHDGIFTAWALDVLIEGNLVERNGEHGIYVSNSADNPIIRNNIVRNNWSQGIQINADGEMEGDGIITNWEISGNMVIENSLRGGSTAINLDGAVRGRAFNNLLYANGKGGFALWEGNANAPASHNVFFNNTVYHPKGTKAAFIFYTGAAHNILFNNILYSKSGGIEHDETSGKGNRHDFNLVSSVIGEGKMSRNDASPPLSALFVDAAKGDLRPRVGSPAIGKGTARFAGHASMARDLAGQARPADAAPDIGCYQHPSTTTAGKAGSGTLTPAGAPGGSSSSSPSLPASE